MTSPFPIIGINTNYEPEPGGGEMTRIKPAYWQTVVDAGGLPVLMPQLDDQAMIDAFLDRVDGFVMIGGDDLSDRVLGSPGPPTAIPLTPLREKSDFTLLDRLLERRIPTLAICLACQQLNVLHGGTLYRDLPWDGPAVLMRHYSRLGGPGPNHALEIEPGSALNQALGATEAEVNSFHHQAIREVGGGLVRTAWAPDGITEAIEVEGQPFFLGVQWHPERMRQAESTRKLFAALLHHAVKSER
jgi:putative glutamine amidotransferase